MKRWLIIAVVVVAVLLAGRPPGCCSRERGCAASIARAVAAEGEKAARLYERLARQHPGNRGLLPTLEAEALLPGMDAVRAA